MATDEKKVKAKDSTKNVKVKDSEVSESTVKTSKTTSKLITGTGRRKTAVARVFLYEDRGEIIVNEMPIEDYFPSEKAQVVWLKPFHLIGVSHPKSKYAATIKVHGSGKNAQLEAVVHGISKALASIDPEFSDLLRKNSMLTRDSRMVERKKPYLKKARKAPQYSKR